MSREIQSCPNHKQRLQMESLRFECVETEDPQMATWKGYGLRFELPVNLETSHDDAMRAVIAAARADGKREHQDHFNAWLTLATGRNHRS
jgi:hypothetical protein